MSSLGNQDVRYRNSAQDNTLVLLRAGTTGLYGWNIHNPNATEAFLLFFNKAATADVTLGGDVPDFSIKIGGNGTVFEKINADPLFTFDLGCVVAATTTELGSTSPAVGLSVVLFRR